MLSLAHTKNEGRALGVNDDNAWGGDGFTSVGQAQPLAAPLLVKGFLAVFCCVCLKQTGLLSVVDRLLDSVVVSLILPID